MQKITTSDQILSPEIKCVEILFDTFTPAKR